MKPWTRMRLAKLLRPRREHPPRRPHPATYDEDEVRALIYGWHSGTVEPPEPADSSRLAAAHSGSPASAGASGVLPGEQPSHEHDVVPADGATAAAEPD